MIAKRALRRLLCPDVAPLTLFESLPELDPRRSDKLRRRLYASLKYSSVGTQHTWLGRFHDLDEILTREIREAFHPEDSIRIHDMAVSGGITSVDLFERVAAERQNISLHASEFFDALYVVSLPKTSWQAIFNRAVAPVQFVRGRTAIAADGHGRDLASLALQRWLHRRVLPDAICSLNAVLSGPSGGKSAHLANSVRTISLFHPRCEALARADPRFTLGRDDFYAPNATAANVVRLMNALHPVLSEAQVKHALLGIHRAVLIDGIFMIGTRTPAERGVTLYRRTKQGFVAIKKIDGGSFWSSTINEFSTGEQ